MGRYQFNFQEAKEACEQQGSCLATFEQLFAAWEEDNLDWCNAGWLADGTAQYPVSVPRDACGGTDLAPGVRSYGVRHKTSDRFDAFCFTSSIRGDHFALILHTHFIIHFIRNTCTLSHEIIQSFSHLDFLSVIQEQEFEAIECTGSLDVDSKILEKHLLGFFFLFKDLFS